MTKEETMATIDLDKAREERIAKRNGKVAKFTFGKEEFLLPPECPLMFSIGLQEGDIRGAMQVLLGDEAAKLFWSMDPSNDDLVALTIEIAKVYGMPEKGTGA